LNLAAAKTSAPGSPAAPRTRTAADAARYAVLRRLSSALKHDMVVHLQAVAMMAEVANARLERDSLTSAELQTTLSKMNRLSREAVMNCLKVAAWIDPGEEVGVPLHQGVQECITLLAAGFSFRRIALASEVAETDFEVSRSAFRNLLTACLLSITDSNQAPCDVTVQAQVQEKSATITLTCTPGHRDGDNVPFEIKTYPLEWTDVQALATLEGAELERHAPESIKLSVQRAVPTGPLQIAPL